jgi:predicted metal-dependent phosphoesterase TrpH
MAVDLHIHSSASDGGFSPSEVVEHAKRIGLKVISLTDHDTVDGIEKAIKKAEELGIEFIPGIELTAINDGREVHILGYFIDHRNEALLKHIRETSKRIVGRVEKILGKLKELGYEVTMEEVREVGNRGTIGRPHIARVMVKRGYVRTHQEAFNRFLGDNCPAYVGIDDAIGPEVAYDLIRGAGGLASIAHPGFLGRADMMKELEICNHIEWGASAIEVYHTKHDNYMTDYYKRMAKKYSLAVTGGSDCHGDYYSQILMEKSFVPDWVAEKLKAYYEKYREQLKGKNKKSK